MKKPDITKGKWNVELPDNDMGLVLVNTEEETTIHDGFDLNNAKAISALPELLDALMGVMHSIEECRLDNGGIALGDVLEENVKSALIKAGVEL